MMLCVVMLSLTGPVCYGGSNLKHYLGYDDALGRIDR